MNLLTAIEGKRYIITKIETDDYEMEDFLFSLGCYEGEPITVISQVRAGSIVAVKDGRYIFDKRLSSRIELREG